MYYKVLLIKQFPSASLVYINIIHFINYLYVKVCNCSIFQGCSRLLVASTSLIILMVDCCVKCCFFLQLICPSKHIWWSVFSHIQAMLLPHEPDLWQFKCCRIQPRCPKLTPITLVVVPSTSLAVVAVCRCGYVETWWRIVNGDCAGGSTLLATR